MTIDAGYYVAAFAEHNCPRVLTKEGANAYAKENPDFLRLFLQETSQVLSGASAQHVLQFTALLLDVSLTNATPSIVAQHVPVEDFDSINSHARGHVLSELAESEEWIDGKAQIETHHHLFVTQCVCQCFPLFPDSIIARESNESAFGTLAKLCSIRMDPPLALELLQLVERSTSAAKVITHTEGVFQVLLSDLELCGALSLVFCAMAMPPFRYGDPRFDTEEDKESWKLLCHYVITPIEREPRLVGKKLRPGTATGDTLKNMVEESLLSSSLDRSTDNDVTNALKRLYRSAVLLAAGSRKVSRSK